MEVVERTLIHQQENKDGHVIPSNILEFSTVIINYCAAYTVDITENVTDNPFLVVLNITDNI